VAEANAIGTTALRPRLLPRPHNIEINKLLRKYVKVRLDITQRVASAAQLNAAIVRSSEIHEALWRRPNLSPPRITAWYRQAQ
jgi:hypothetical protein